MYQKCCLDENTYQSLYIQDIKIKLTLYNRRWVTAFKTHMKMEEINRNLDRDKKQNKMRIIRDHGFILLTNLSGRRMDRLTGNKLQMSAVIL